LLSGNLLSGNLLSGRLLFRYTYILGEFSKTIKGFIMATIASPRQVLSNQAVDPTAYGNDEAWRNFKAPSYSTNTPTGAKTSLSPIPQEQRAVLDYPDTLAEAALKRG
jgi:hypothetical protein